MTDLRRMKEILMRLLIRTRTYRRKKFDAPSIWTMRSEAAHSMVRLRRVTSVTKTIWTELDRSSAKVAKNGPSVIATK